jgi:2-methylcitrate dehydratase PrpD
MANTENIIDRLSENILKTRFEDIDRETIDNTRRRILDMIGCTIGGANTTDNGALARLVEDWGGKKESSILGYGIKSPAPTAALVNCVFGRTFDRGPLTNIINGQRYPNHTTETTVLTALALGEIKGISGKELMTAIIAGDDLAARLHIASDHSQPGQVSSPGGGQPPATRGTTAPFGAAAIAGRLLGLNSTQLKRAFGITVIMMGGGGSALAGGPSSRVVASGAPKAAGTPKAAPPVWAGVNDPNFIAALASGGYEETTSVKLNNGLEALRGIISAQMAQVGWTGVKDAFFGRGGYFPGVESVNHPERVTDFLGQKYYVEQVFKPYPGGKPTHAPTDAALAVVRKHSFNIEDVQEVILHLSPPATAMHYAKPYVVGEYPTMNALWSYYFAVASTLVRKSSRNENYTENNILDPRVQNLIKKVKLADLDKPVGVEVEVVMKDGQRYTEYVKTASGEPSTPMTRDDLVAKFMEQVEFSQMISRPNAEKLVELLEKLDQVDDIRKIVALAVKK